MCGKDITRGARHLRSRAARRPGADPAALTSAGSLDRAHPLRRRAERVHVAGGRTRGTRAAAPVDRARPARALDGKSRRLGTRRRARMAAARARAGRLRPPARACGRPALLRLVPTPARGRLLPLRRQRPQRLAAGPALARTVGPPLVRLRLLGRLRELLRGDVPARRFALVLRSGPLPPLRRLRRAPRRDGVRHVRALPRRTAVAREPRRASSSGRRV